MGNRFGYIRIFKKEKNFDTQIENLKLYVIDEKNIYSDKASVRHIEREGFQNLLRVIRKGDTLYLNSVDHLGRTKQQIGDYLKQLDERGVRVKIISLSSTIKSSVESEEKVLEIINSVIIKIYTLMAQQQKETMKQRQLEGIAAAKAKGIHIGRPVLELPNEWGEIYKEWKGGKVKTKTFIDKMNMKKSTFYKKVKEYENR
ncbi:recombinase family protein [Priestia aryabhattai]|uniref:recombinase family protein n=1 Tax=Priestia TaxID=2800373 RepID=UPI001E2B732A|nr:MULTISPECIES: recombinase family protein [Priestia]MCE4092776.1 recombinase family protein [Priestia megaterium]MED3822014.1 recombinase family protein [Priestia aryabhattai]